MQSRLVNKKIPTRLSRDFNYYSRQRSTLPHGYPSSTIDAERLNFCVRNGSACSAKLCWLRRKTQKPRCGWAKTAAAIEAIQVRFVVHVQPLQSGASSYVCGTPYQLRADATPPVFGSDGGIQQERMHAAVPRDVNEPDQPAKSESTDICEAVRQDRAKRSASVPGPRRSKQPIQFGVVDHRRDAILYVHIPPRITSVLYGFRVVSGPSPDTTVVLAKKIPAAFYSPTRLPEQYHRRREA
jgi:hypothetical protein